jgi:hypothetical protein
LRCEGGTGDDAALGDRAGSAMTGQYLMGELSVRLELLQAAAPSAASEIARLRADAEGRSPWALAPVLDRALGLAERLCWRSLARGDAIEFDRVAGVSAGLRGFGVCARMLDED